MANTDKTHIANAMKGHNNAQKSKLSNIQVTPQNDSLMPQNIPVKNQGNNSIMNYQNCGC